MPLSWVYWHVILGSVYIVTIEVVDWQHHESFYHSHSSTLLTRHSGKPTCAKTNLLSSHNILDPRPVLARKCVQTFHNPLWTFSEVL